MSFVARQTWVESRLPFTSYAIVSVRLSPRPPSPGDKTRDSP